MAAGRRAKSGVGPAWNRTRPNRHDRRVVTKVKCGHRAESSLCETENMSLRTDDKAWIDGRIADAMGATRPHGWRKLFFVLREIGPIGASIAMVIALVGITLGALYQSFSHLGEETKFRTHTEDRLTTIEADIKSINAALDAIRLTQLSQNPANSQNAKQATVLLADARAKHIKLDTSVVEDSGNRFIAAATQNDASWSAANQSVSYRSFLNADSLPDTGPLEPTKEPYQLTFHLRPKPGSPKPPPDVLSLVLNVAGKAPPENSYRIEELDKPEQGSTGIAYAILEMRADILVLDGLYMKNVIVKNSTVQYDGGPLKLERVYFVNCEFISPLTPNGQALNRTLLASASTTFTFSAKSRGSSGPPGGE